jgi:hypothetical protein
MGRHYFTVEERFADHVRCTAGSLSVWLVLL